MVDVSKGQMLTFYNHCIAKNLVSKNKGIENSFWKWGLN